MIHVGMTEKRGESQTSIPLVLKKPTNKLESLINVEVHGPFRHVQDTSRNHFKFHPARSICLSRPGKKDGKSNKSKPS